jgi:nucleoside-diphosphate-sugar epimerase
MIIGKGLIGGKFDIYKDDDAILIFASGVSNSNEISSVEFKREESLLIDSLNKFKNKKLIYFSTCSMNDTYSEIKPYTNHKLNMEDIIKKYSKNYIICRLPQVIGKNNKYQLMGYLHSTIKKNEKFNLYNIERNIIDVDDVKLVVMYIIKHSIFTNKIINIANPINTKVIDLVKKIENIYNYKAKYNVIQMDGELKIDISDIKPIIDELNLFEEKYIENKIRKYYG